MTYNVHHVQVSVPLLPLYTKDLHGHCNFYQVLLDIYH